MYLNVSTILGALRKPDEKEKSLESIFDGKGSGALRDLLEDFEIVSTLQHVALISRSEHVALHTNVRAALQFNATQNRTTRSVRI